MWVRMRTTAAGPQGALEAERRYNLPPDFARQLIELRCAVELEPPVRTRGAADDVDDEWSDL